MRYLERRLLHAVLLLMGVSVFCFLFADLAPGSFFDEMKLNPQISRETVDGLKHQYGLDRPLAVRYVRWVESVAKGDWGYSFAYASPVRPLLVVRARNTLLLSVVSTFLVWVIAIPLGVWVASRRGHWADRLCLGGTSLLLSVPELVIALVFLSFAIHTRLLPVGGMASLHPDRSLGWAGFSDLALHLVIPSAVLVLGALPVVVRHVRASMIEVLDAPFIQAARGHGLNPTRILFRYALPASAKPLVSLFGFSVGGLLSGSLLVEAIIGWPGLGPLLIEASMSRDLYIVVGAVMLSTLFMVAGNLMADLLLVAVDPRIRAE
jgi:peptide/nickel transport system permease protein